MNKVLDKSTKVRQVGDAKITDTNSIIKSKRGIVHRQVNSVSFKDTNQRTVMHQTVCEAITERSHRKVWERIVRF